MNVSACMVRLATVCGLHLMAVTFIRHVLTSGAS